VAGRIGTVGLAGGVDGFAGASRGDPRADAALAAAAQAPPPFGRAEAALVLLCALAGAVLLFLSAPNQGEFWWSDSPRHALNSVFVRDLLAALPWQDPAGWAMQYYVQYPALTILFYPPLFYAIGAGFVALLGVSHATLLIAVLAHFVALVLGLHLLARRFVPPGIALAVALSAMAAPGTALWGRQVMLEIPCMAFAVWGLLVLRRHAEAGGAWRLHGGLLLLLAAVYTKFSAVFLLPVAALMPLAADPAMLRRRQTWLAAAWGALALAPAVALTLRFGAANAQSVVGIADAAVPRWSVAGWTWYAEQLPGLLGWPLLVAAVGGLAVLLLRPAAAGEAGRRADLVLIFGWIGVGYVFFSLIDLKEARHATLILPPLLVAAGVAAAAIGAPLARRGVGGIGALLAAGLFAATAAWTARAAPVPYHAGYRDAALWLAEHAPRDAVIVFSGKRDGSFVFNMRAIADRRPDLFTVRADKLLLSVAVRRELGVSERPYTEAEIADLLARVGAGLVVAQPGFWTDLEAKRRFEAVLASGRYTEAARIPVRSNRPEEDRELRIYRATGEVAAAEGRLSIDLPIIGRSVEGRVPTGR
jgi:4-amino-4-deoxy-L-arabinose transferase-like glycosyltransferase